jgi:hypothetical protein
MSKGPIYGVELLDALPLDGGMMQAMPNWRDLEQTREHNDRVAAGFEVLTEHYRRQAAEIERLRDELDKPASGYHAVSEDYCQTLPLVREFSHLPTLEDRVRAMADDRERLQAIVARLPTTEDGVPITPGMTLYDSCNGGKHQITVTGFDTGQDGALSALFSRKGFDAICSGYYSTREAAEKARDE